MTVGLKTVREMCVRCPLVMGEELLSDLVLYQKERDKHVKNAAKALAALFRELKPSMLQKNQRGRAADMSLDLPAYGAATMQRRCGSVFTVCVLPCVCRVTQQGSTCGLTEAEIIKSFCRVDGAELLEAALARGSNSDSDASDICSLEGSDDAGAALSAAELADNDGGNSGDAAAVASDDDSSDDEASAAEVAEVRGDESDIDEADEARGSGGVARSNGGESGPSGRSGVQEVVPTESLAGLKRVLATCAMADMVGPEASEARDPIECDRVLTQEDFERIRKLKVRAAGVCDRLSTTRMLFKPQQLSLACSCPQGLHE